MKGSDELQLIIEVYAAADLLSGSRHAQHGLLRPKQKKIKDEIQSQAFLTYIGSL
jgi:hypothetical protein